jgi:hypothetical protein
MLKITIHDSAAALRFRLEGRLTGPWVDELRQCWRTAASTTGGRETVLDLREVDFVCPDGQELLSEMYGKGVRLLAATPLIQAMVEEISHSSDCGTVEEELAPRSNAFLRTHTAGHNPRSL